MHPHNYQPINFSSKKNSNYNEFWDFREKEMTIAMQENAKEKLPNSRTLPTTPITCQREKKSKSLKAHAFIDAQGPNTTPNRQKR